MDSEISTTASPPGVANAQVILKPRKARPFFGRHPWVLDSAVDHVEGQPADGAVVDLLADNGKFVARGLYNSQSRIRVRLYTWSPADRLDQDFWKSRIERAVEHRRRLGYDAVDGAARLIYSEADGLSGLVVDRYGRYLVVQATALAMQRRIDELLPVLADASGARGIVVRADRTLAKLEGLAVDEERTWGEVPQGPVFIEEHGIRYGVELGLGQKTGFYLDQRENRSRRGRLRARRAGARFVLLHRRLQPGRGQAGRRGRSGGRRLQRKGGHHGPRRRGAELAPQHPLRGGRRFQRAGRAGPPARAVRHGDSRSAKIHPHAAARWTTPCGPITASIGWERRCCRPAARW